MKSIKALFDPITTKNKRSPGFEHLRSSPNAEAARRMLEDVFQTFSDPDGNFVEQFQTTGFDARFFELYLYDYFSRSGYRVDRSQPKPDFLVERQAMTIAVEATTVNPSTSGAVAKFGRRISTLREEGRRDYQANELPIRFGSALFSKLKKRYWELPQCAGLPFVIAIEAFHDKESLQFSDNSLASYLYGLRDSSYWTDEGDLVFKSEKISTHTLGEKKIPSGFFHQPNTESVSAVLFTNSGTSAKFSRMGYQSGYGNAILNLKRSGLSYDFSPNAMDSTLFAYDLDDPPFVEDWGQGLVILHNPNAIRPLPSDFFERCVQWRFEAGDAAPYIPNWHAYRSDTLISCVGELKEKLPKVFIARGPQAVGAIDKRRFHDLCSNLAGRIAKSGEEDGWFADHSEAFLGLVVKNARGRSGSVLCLHETNTSNSIQSPKNLVIECVFSLPKPSNTKSWNSYSSRREFFPKPDNQGGLRFYRQLPKQKRINIRKLFDLLSHRFPRAVAGFAFDS